MLTRKQTTWIHVTLQNRLSEKRGPSSLQNAHLELLSEDPLTASHELKSGPHVQIWIGSLRAAGHRFCTITAQKQTLNTLRAGASSDGLGCSTCLCHCRPWHRGYLPIGVPNQRWSRRTQFCWTLVACFVPQSIQGHIRTALPT